MALKWSSLRKDKKNVFNFWGGVRPKLKNFNFLGLFFLKASLSYGLGEGRNLNLKNKFFIMILKIGLPSLNLLFSGPKSQNEKVSVLIGKIIS